MSLHAYCRVHRGLLNFGSHQHSMSMSPDLVNSGLVVNDYLRDSVHCDEIKQPECSVGQLDS